MIIYILIKFEKKPPDVDLTIFNDSAVDKYIKTNNKYLFGTILFKVLNEIL